MAKIIHSMIRVLDLDRSLKFYAECFDLKPAHTLDFPSFSLVYLRNVTITITVAVRFGATFVVGQLNLGVVLGVAQIDQRKAGKIQGVRRL